MIFRSFPVLVIVSLSVASVRADSHTPSRLLPKRLVLAHYMTNLVPCSVGETKWASPELYDPLGTSRSLGGLHLTLPMWSVLQPDMSLLQAAEFEIRTARQLGVDGFQFFYPMMTSSRQLEKYNRIIRQFIQVAEARYPDFRLTLCLSCASRFPNQSEDDAVELWGTALHRLLRDTGESPIWLRTQDGCLLFYEWVSDGLADGVRHRANTPEQLRRTARAFRRLGSRAGKDIDWVFHVRRREIDDCYIDCLMQEFPAVWGWVDSDEDTEFWDYLAERCRQSDVMWTQTVYPDYFTSKVYSRNDRHPKVLPPARASTYDIHDIERHYRQTDLASGQIRLLQAAIHRDAEIINYVTWNDWPEGHHLAPEVNHNFGPSLLLRHFKAEWQQRPSPLTETGILFYKKHPSPASARHSIAVRVKSRRNRPSDEDRIQLVTVLDHPAQSTMNGQDTGQIKSGFQVTNLPLPQNGRIDIALRRAGEARPFMTLRPPVSITRRPRRIDRLTYSWSSKFEQEFHRVFGDEAIPPPVVSP